MRKLKESAIQPTIVKESLKPWNNYGCASFSFIIENERNNKTFKIVRKEGKSICLLVNQLPTVNQLLVELTYALANFCHLFKTLVLLHKIRFLYINLALSKILL